jgi:hypothetical protein
VSDVLLGLRLLLNSGCLTGVDEFSDWVNSLLQDLYCLPSSYFVTHYEIMMHTMMI